MAEASFSQADVGRFGGRPQVIDVLLALRQKLADWEIGPDEIFGIQEDCIGFGSTSVVYLGYLRGVPEPVAVKEVVLSQLEEQYGCQDEGIILAITRELEVWPEINHPSILKFLGFCFSPDRTTLRIVSQHCRGGTLFDLLHNCWHIRLSNAQKKRILLDCARAVDYLHNIQKPVMHRDLKSLNVFVLEPVVDERSDVRVKLADFGFARIRPERSGWTDLTSGVGTPHWMAPEVAQGLGYHLKADVFSFAVIMYEVVCRHMAFETLDAQQVQQTIAQGHRPPLDGREGVDTHVPNGTPRELRALISRCWSQGPLDRPSMGVVVEELQRIEWPED